MERITLNDLQQKRTYLQKKKKAVFDPDAIDVISKKLAETENELRNLYQINTFICILDRLPEIDLQLTRETFTLTRCIKKKAALRHWFDIDNLKEDLVCKIMELEQKEQDLLIERDMRMTHSPEEIDQLQKEYDTLLRNYRRNKEII